MIKCYYENQHNYTHRDYGHLNSYFNRMFLYEEYYREEIKELDLSRMTKETLVILHCVLDYYHILEKKCEEYPNLTPCKDVSPIKEPIKLVKKPFMLFPNYTEMGVLY